MANQKFLCCGAKICTRILAWINIIFNAIFTTLFLSTVSYRIDFILTPWVFEDASQNATFSESVYNGLQYSNLTVDFNDGNFTTREKEYMAEKKALEAAFLRWDLFWMFVNLIMGILLLIGSHKKSTTLLKAFIIFEGISIFGTIAGILLNSVLGVDGVGSNRVFSCVVTIVLGLFTLWVALTHKQEIQMGRRQTKPFVNRS